MKNFLFILITAINTSTVFAQEDILKENKKEQSKTIQTLDESWRNTGYVSLKPKVGLNISNLIGEGNSNSRFGVNIGLECEAFLSKTVSLSAGVFYSMQGARGNTIVYNSARLNANIKSDYIKVPVMLNLYANDHVAFKVGAQFGFRVYDSYTLKNADDGVKKSGSLSDVGYELNGLEFSIPVGISYEISNFIIEAGYNIGVTKMCKDVNVRHSVFQIMFGYKFKMK